MDHVKTQAPYAIFVALIAVFLGDLLTNYLYPMWVGLLLTIVAVVVIGYFISAKPDSESDKIDLVSKLFGSCGCCGLGKLFKSKKKGGKSGSDSDSDDTEGSGGVRKIDNGAYSAVTTAATTLLLPPCATAARRACRCSRTTCARAAAMRKLPHAKPRPRTGAAPDADPGGPRREVQPFRQGTL